MNEIIFIEKMKILLECDQEINLNCRFSDFDAYDSLTLMSISAWLSDEYKIEISVDELEKLEKLNDLYIKINK